MISTVIHWTIKCSAHLLIQIINGMATWNLHEAESNHNAERKDATYGVDQNNEF
jgi:hypothetical protein